MRKEKLVHIAGRVIWTKDAACQKFISINLEIYGNLQCLWICKGASNKLLFVEIARWLWSK